VNTRSEDVRESLTNDRRQGPAHQISLPKEMITRLHGFMIDVDPDKLIPGNPVLDPSDDPVVFLARLEPLLQRHPIAQNAEVRATGRGLHLIVWFNTPVELHTTAEQTEWDATIGLVQLTLPADPACPALTALTRPVGAVNSKNGHLVRLLRPGRPVSSEEVRQYARQVAAAPMRELVAIWFGGIEVRPCPICGRAEGILKALENTGHCYTCGKVSLEMVAERVYRVPPKPTTSC
jgi:hypothetical protein